MKEKYTICNEGCDDTTYGEFEFTEEEFSFLNNLFKELNKNSHYGCMPKIFVYKQDHPTEKVCTGKRCPMQVGYDVKNCKDKNCIYRTETEKGGAEE